MHGFHSVPPTLKQVPSKQVPRLFILGGAAKASLVARELGCEIVASEMALSVHAMEVAEAGLVDCAVVELVLHNGIADTVIRALQRRDVPVVICSSIMRNAVAELYPGAAVLANPYSLEELRDAIACALKPVTC